MRTYALISQKGGAGKSTLATSLATIAGEEEPTFLADLDPQATSSKWYDRRQEGEAPPARPELISLDGKSLSAVLAGTKRAAGVLFLDTRPAVQAPEAEAASCADLVIVPVRPSINDLEAVGDTLRMLKRLGRPAVLIVNGAKTKGRALEARAALGQFGFPVCPTHIADRSVYLDAAIEGRAVTEMRGTAAAAASDELRQAWKWIEETRQ